MTDPSLHRLLQVQDQDTLVDQLVHRREHHPLREDLVGLDRREAEIVARSTPLRQERDAARRRQAELEREAETAQARRGQVESRMYSGEVTAARDLQSMAAEAQALQARQAHLEDEVLEVMEALEPLEAQVAAADEALGTLEQERRELQGQLTQAEASLSQEEQDHRRQREELAAGVAPPLLDRYEKLRARLGGVAAAPLVNGSCGGCHLKLPATELNALMKSPADAIVACEQCGRILVRP